MDTPSILLTILVGGIAFFYASVGFGGATGYLGVMSQFDIDPNLMATTALALNLCVSGIAFFNYARAGYIEKRLLLSFPLASVPASFLGGYIKLNEEIYFLLLYIVLTYVMIHMFFTGNNEEIDMEKLRPPNLWLAIVVGAVIGLLSGTVGIGGGIILSPLIILMRWGNPKQAASTSAGFIFLNSLSGLIGRSIGGNLILGEFGTWLLPAGILGALAGSYIGAQQFSGFWSRKVLGVVLLVAVVRFWGRFLF